MSERQHIPAEPGPVPGHVPGDAPGQVPGDAPGQVPGDASGQVPGQVPGEAPGASRVDPEPATRVAPTAGTTRVDSGPPPTRADTPPQGHRLPDRTGAAPRPVAVRRPDNLGGLLLVLAGVAAAISLLLAWASGSDQTGYGLVRDGFSDFARGTGFSSGLWQPVFVVLGGGVLLVLGLLLLVPARRHRFLGLLALAVALAAAVAVLVALAGVSWDLSRFDTGIYFAMAVAALGLLGALKALLTRSRTARPGTPSR